ncbi:MAG TPA: hypothetical protein VNX68_14650, partial [Nitrosopumilaceae archaeon]|nr:hypothetical protein [Nitrosopumilaceae archaeon]
LVSNSLLKKEPESMEERFYYHLIHSACAILNKEQEVAYWHSSFLISIFENQHWLIKDSVWQKRRGSVIDNHFLICTELSKTDEAERTFALMRDQPEQVLPLSQKYTNLLEALAKKGLFENARPYLQEIEELISTKGDKMDENVLSVLYLNMCIAYFGSGQYKKSLKSVNQLLNKKDSFMREDLVSMAHLINLIIHFELGNEDLLPYRIKSARRFLNKKNRIYKFEEAFLTFVEKKLLLAFTAEEQKQSFVQLLKELEIILLDPFEKQIEHYFDFLAWVTGKIQNKSLALVLQNKKSSANS